MEFIFSEIKPEDVTVVFTLVQELAVETKIADKFKMTKERMHKELFEAHADWNALVIKKDDQEIIGFCFYTIANINRAYHDGPVIQVDDFYIKPEYRRNGLGQSMLARIGQIAKEKGILRIEMWCVKSNTIGQNFYSKQKAKKADLVDIYRFYAKELYGLSG